MLSVIMLNVTYKLLMLSAIMLSVVMLIVVMLNVTYKPLKLNVIMLSVVMLSVVFLNVVMLIVVAPKKTWM